MSIEPTDKDREQCASIIQLLAAGLPAISADDEKIAFFTGGPNGSGKSTLIFNQIGPYISHRCTRNPNTFYATVARLANEGKLFAPLLKNDDIRDIYEIYDKGSVMAGQYLWGQFIDLYNDKELGKVLDFNFMLLNGDTTAYFTDQAIAAKMDQGANFRITEHYYRTLKMLPELAEAACNTGLAFIIDSTMSDRSSIFTAMDKIKAHNTELTGRDRYKTSAIICFPENPDKAVEAVIARGSAVGRIINPENARNSQQKFRDGFGELWPNITQRVDFSLLCVLNNESENPALNPIYSKGEPFYGAKMTLSIHSPKDDAATIGKHDFLAETVAACRASNKR